MVYDPFIFYLDDWFVKCKGLAYGIFWAGAGVGSSVLPFVMEWGLRNYGFRTTLRALGVFMPSAKLSTSRNLPPSSAVTATLTVFLLWGFATTPLVVYTFSVLFGITAGGYTACWTGCAKEVKMVHEQASKNKSKLEGNKNAEGTVEVAVVMGTMAAGRGFACFVSGPIGEALLELPRLHGKMV
ncbi:MAG: hypothetical protein Q9170_003159 [Blastenia crenularia]